jgi:hypothetical protein
VVNDEIGQAVVLFNDVDAATNDQTLGGKIQQNKVTKYNFIYIHDEAFSLILFRMENNNYSAWYLENEAEICYQVKN